MNLEGIEGFQRQRVMTTWHRERGSSTFQALREADELAGQTYSPVLVDRRERGACS
jgi:hypothetical protein